MFNLNLQTNQLPQLSQSSPIPTIFELPSTSILHDDSQSEQKEAIGFLPSILPWDRLRNAFEAGRIIDSHGNSLIAHECSVPDWTGVQFQELLRILCQPYFVNGYENRIGPAILYTLIRGPNEAFSSKDRILAKGGMLHSIHKKSNAEYYRRYCECICPESTRYISFSELFRGEPSYSPDFDWTIEARSANVRTRRLIADLFVQYHALRIFQNLPDQRTQSFTKKAIIHNFVEVNPFRNRSTKSINTNGSQFFMLTVAKVHDIVIQTHLENPCLLDSVAVDITSLFNRIIIELNSLKRIFFSEIELVNQLEALFVSLLHPQTNITMPLAPHGLDGDVHASLLARLIKCRKVINPNEPNRKRFARAIFDMSRGIAPTSKDDLDKVFKILISETTEQGLLSESLLSKTICELLEDVVSKHAIKPHPLDYFVVKMICIMEIQGMKHVALTETVKNAVSDYIWKSIVWGTNSSKLETKFWEDISSLKELSYSDMISYLQLYALSAMLDVSHTRQWYELDAILTRMGQDPAVYILCNTSTTQLYIPLRLDFLLSSDGLKHFKDQLVALSSSQDLTQLLKNRALDLLRCTAPDQKDRSSFFQLAPYIEALQFPIEQLMALFSSLLAYGNLDTSFCYSILIRLLQYQPSQYIQPELIEHFIFVWDFLPVESDRQHLCETILKLFSSRQRYSVNILSSSLRHDMLCWMLNQSLGRILSYVKSGDYVKRFDIARDIIKLKNILILSENTNENHYILLRILAYLNLFSDGYELILKKKISSKSAIDFIEQYCYFLKGNATELWHRYALVTQHQLSPHSRALQELITDIQQFFNSKNLHYSSDEITRLIQKNDLSENAFLFPLAVEAEIKSFLALNEIEKAARVFRTHAQSSLFPKSVIETLHLDILSAAILKHNTKSLSLLTDPTLQLQPNSFWIATMQLLNKKMLETQCHAFMHSIIDFLPETTTIIECELQSKVMDFLHKFIITVKKPSISNIQKLLDFFISRKAFTHSIKLITYACSMRELKLSKLQVRLLLEEMDQWKLEDMLHAMETLCCVDKSISKQPLFPCLLGKIAVEIEVTEARNICAFHTFLLKIGTHEFIQQQWICDLFLKLMAIEEYSCAIIWLPSILNLKYLDFDSRQLAPVMFKCLQYDLLNRREYLHLWDVFYRKTKEWHDPAFKNEWLTMAFSAVLAEDWLRSIDFLYYEISLFNAQESSTVHNIIFTCLEHISVLNESDPTRIRLNRLSEIILKYLPTDVSKIVILFKKLAEMDAGIPIWKLLEYYEHNGIFHDHYPVKKMCWIIALESLRDREKFLSLSSKDSFYFQAFKNEDETEIAKMHCLFLKNSFKCNPFFRNKKTRSNNKSYSERIAKEKKILKRHLLIVASIKSMCQKELSACDQVSYPYKYLELTHWVKMINEIKDPVRSEEKKLWIDFVYYFANYTSEMRSEKLKKLYKIYLKCLDTVLKYMRVNTSLDILFHRCETLKIVIPIKFNIYKFTKSDQEREKKRTAFVNSIKMYLEDSLALQNCAKGLSVVGKDNGMKIRIKDYYIEQIIPNICCIIPHYKSFISEHTFKQRFEIAKLCIAHRVHHQGIAEIGLQFLYELMFTLDDSQRDRENAELIADYFKSILEDCHRTRVSSHLYFLAIIKKLKKSSFFGIKPEEADKWLENAGYKPSVGRIC